MRGLLSGLLSSLVVSAVFASTAPLNDTGQTLCLNADATGRAECTESTTSDNAPYPRQDGRFGRDPEAGAHALTEVGGGLGGFDFKRICGTGEVAGSGTCPLNPLPGDGPDDWACTRDTVTGRVGEVKPPANANAVFSFAAASDVHAANANAAERCGFDDWRLPRRRELLSIVYHGAESGPVVDPDFFPNTTGTIYWSGDPYAPPGPASAWTVLAGNGDTSVSPEISAHSVRLVRAEPGGGSARSEAADSVSRIGREGGARAALVAWVDNGDGTVTDPTTGMTWDRCAWGQSWDGAGACTGTAAMQDWQTALGVAVSANAIQHLG